MFSPGVALIMCLSLSFQLLIFGGLFVMFLGVDHENLVSVLSMMGIWCIFVVVLLSSFSLGFCTFLGTILLLWGVILVLAVFKINTPFLCTFLIKRRKRRNRRALKRN